jgi:hypothetical protein
MPTPNVDWRVSLVDSSGGAIAALPAQGSLTHNNAAPAANNMGVLPAIANAASPTFTEGDQVLLSTDLSALLRVKAAGFQAVGTAIASNPMIVAGQFSGNVKLLGLDTNGGIQQGAQNAGGTTSWNIQGAAATGAAPVGNPVYIGGLDPTGGTTVNPLQVQSAASPNLRVGLYQSGLQATVNAPSADGISAATNSLFAVAAQTLYNGTSMDRQRNNVDVTLLASAARTTLQNSANITTYNCKGIIVTVDVTATVSTVSLTPSINYIDPASGKAIPLLTGTTIAATGTFTYWVNENALASVAAPFTKTAQADLGRIITINIAVGNANSQTYSVGYTLIP